MHANTPSHPRSPTHPPQPYPLPPCSYLFTQFSVIFAPSLMELCVVFLPFYMFNRLMVRGGCHMRTAADQPAPAPTQPAACLHACVGTT
jgi:hypothetical protein